MPWDVPDDGNPELIKLPGTGSKNESPTERFEREQRETEALIESQQAEADRAYAAKRKPQLDYPVPTREYESIPIPVAEPVIEQRTESAAQREARLKAESRGGTMLPRMGELDYSNMKSPRSSIASRPAHACPDCRAGYKAPSCTGWCRQ